MSEPLTELDAIEVVPGNATGLVLRLDEPLSFWGGLDAQTGVIIDRLHPQCGVCVTSTVLLLPSGRGSSSASSVLAEAVRLGTAPAALVLSEPDEILVLGSLVAEELYGTVTPVVVCRELASAKVRTGQLITVTTGEGTSLIDTVELRAATPDDAAVVADYHDRCFKATYATQLREGAFTPPDYEGTKQQLLSWFQPGSECETWVAVVDGRPIAHFTLNDHNLVHLFVEPEHQGIGLGRYLLARGETMIAERGHRDFELHARVENVNALAFYRIAGWTVTDRLIHTEEHGISYDEHVLTKRCP